MNSQQSKLVKRIQRFCPQVNRVADSSRAIFVTVKPGDVRKADRKDPANCAMACSFKRNGFDAAIIQPSVAYLVKGDLAIRYRVPETVSREIVSFDRHKDFRPGTYHLRRVSPAQRIGSDHRPSNRGRGDRKSIRRPIAVIQKHRTEGIR